MPLEMDDTRLVGKLVHTEIVIPYIAIWLTGRCHCACVSQPHYRGNLEEYASTCYSVGYMLL